MRIAEQLWMDHALRGEIAAAVQEAVATWAQSTQARETFAARPQRKRCGALSRA